MRKGKLWAYDAIFIHWSQQQRQWIGFDCWKFLCVDLHTQCDNAINQCYFFLLWSLMGLDTYCCLIFYVFTLIHLTDPLSQVIQIMCVMHDIYIYISEKRDSSFSCSISLSFSFLAGEGTHNTLGLNFGCRKGKSSLNPDSHTITNWALSWRQWNEKMAFHEINQGERFVYSRFMHVLMSTWDPMLFKNSSIGIRA